MAIWATHTFTDGNIQRVTCCIKNTSPSIIGLHSGTISLLRTTVPKSLGGGRNHGYPWMDLSDDRDGEVAMVAPWIAKPGETDVNKAGYNYRWGLRVKGCCTEPNPFWLWEVRSLRELDVVVWKAKFCCLFLQILRESGLKGDQTGAAS